MSKSTRKSQSQVSLRKSRASKRESQFASRTFVEPKSQATVFVDQLRSYLRERNVGQPKILIENRKVSEAPEGKDENMPIVRLNFGIDRTNLMGVSCRMNKMPVELLEGVTALMDSFMSIKELKLEFCNLEADHLYLIQQILTNYGNIIYLSLNGNPIEAQNYNVVLQATYLQYLCLELCQINKTGAELLANELSRPEGQTLLLLNLASNFLGNEGIEPIADILRGNRTLMALNVADNRIEKTGLIYMFHAMHRFPLKHDEIVFRRHKNMEYLLKKEELMRTSKSNSSTGSLGRKTTELGKKRRATSEMVKRSITTGSGTASMRSNYESEIEKELNRCNHPFVIDSAPENHEIICTGNNTLIHLNIAYNEVTKTVLNTIIDVIRYQRNTFINNKKKGLMRIIIEGKEVETLYPTLLKEMHEVSKFSLHSMHSSMKHDKASSSSLKRPVSTTN